MRRTWPWLAGLVVLLLAGLVALLSSQGGSHPAAPPPPPPSPSPPPTGAVQLGANVNRLFNDRIYGSVQISGQLRALAATGATLARSDAMWGFTEPAPPSGGAHHYDWAFDDHIAGALAARGLTWLPILDYSAGWDRLYPSLLHSPPRSPADFAAFASALAARYGPGGLFWRGRPDLTPRPVEIYEVWNEPDNPRFWEPVVDPAAYADLYLAARRSVHAADPTARVVIGGLTRASSFLPAMLRARPALAGSVDGVGIHPYGANAAAVLAKVRRARAILGSLGLSAVPLYVTEFGWTTHPAGALDFAPERARPRRIERTLAALGHTNCRVAAVVLYTWLTPERDPRAKEDWFGIHPASGASTSDTEAFAAGIRRAQSPRPVLPVCQ